MWTGLLQLKPVTIRATQFCPTSISSATKSEHYQTKGIEPKFTRNSHLLTFEKLVMDHLTRHGLDTITYLVDPVNPETTVSVVSKHAQFTLKTALLSEATNQTSKYDAYDLDNSKDAITMLLDSLDSDLLVQMYKNCCDDDTFIAYWMNMMSIIGSVSIERFSKFKDDLKKRKIQGYSGQNIEALASDFTSDYKKLHAARMYDHTLTLIMLKTIMEAANEDFRFGLLNTQGQPARQAP